MSITDRITEVDATFVHETDDAYLIDDGSGDDNIWIPKSQVDNIDGDFDTAGELIVGRDYEFTIPEWLAFDKGLI